MQPLSFLSHLFNIESNKDDKEEAANLDTTFKTLDHDKVIENTHTHTHTHTPHLL